MRIFIVLFFFCCIPVGVFAEISAQTFAEVLNAGMTRSDLISKVGEPDRKIDNGAGREAWYYGDAVVFILQDQVAAWSSLRDLRSRTAIKELGQGGQTLEDDTSYTVWLNDWTYFHGLSRGYLVDEVLKDLAKN